uniref:Cilia and flagella associated protein 95 n=1 Tax=Sphenodon punctatus TaxID=8508 RepID=A0A8D0GST2_SPHPU
PPASDRSEQAWTEVLGHLGMDIGPTDVMERKGGLTLRSHSAYYGRPTRVYRWHQNREAEPKDYDIDEIPLGSKNLCQSTYRRFGTYGTTYVCLFSENHYFICRETGLPQTGLGAALPSHHPDRFKMLVATKTADCDVFEPQMDDYSIVHRKCCSQFTDTADYRRHGINTWQDESGIYANADLKLKVFPINNPIPSNVPEVHP